MGIGRIALHHIAALRHLEGFAVVKVTEVSSLCACRPKASAKNSADDLKSAAADAQDEASHWWGEVQNNWKSHDAVRANADEAKANLDAKVVLRRADRAEVDAAAAVAFAYAAYEEAEYQVLNAALARMDAEAVSAE